jgi:hypothetical protein
MQSVTPGLEFMVQPKEYILLNSTDEEIILQHHGETRRIPPRNKVVKKHHKYPDVPCSMRDAQGRYIPGTLTLSDIVIPNSLGGAEVVWNAAEAIKERLGIDINTGTYTSALALRGVSVVPPDASIELIRRIDADGIERWKKFRIRQAAALVATYDSRNEKRKAEGLSPLAPDEKYMRAEAALNQLRAEEAIRLKEEFTKITQIELAPEPDNEMFEDPEVGTSVLLTSEVQEAPPASVDDTPIPVAEAAAELTGEPTPPALRTVDSLSAMEKLQLLEDDPKAIRALRIKYNVRKRSYAKRKPKEAANA